MLPRIVPFSLISLHLGNDGFTVFLGLLDPFRLEGSLLFPQLTLYMWVRWRITHHARAAHRTMDSTWNRIWSSRWTLLRIPHSACWVHTAAWSTTSSALILLIWSGCRLTWSKVSLAATFPMMLRGPHVVISLRVLLDALLEKIFSWLDVILLIKILAFVFHRVGRSEFLFFIMLRNWRFFIVMWRSSFVFKFCKLLSGLKYFTDTWVYFHVFLDENKLILFIDKLKFYSLNWLI